MLLNTNAIVLSAIKFKEHSLIVSCYTKELGIQSYILHHIFKSKKGKLNPAYFQLLTQLEIQTNVKQNQTLHKITEVKLNHSYDSIHINIYKSTVTMFLAEVLQSILKEEEKNIELYNFIETSLLWFDLNRFNPNFHIAFLLKLCQYLGIYPNPYTLDQFFFKHEKNNLKIQILKNILGTDFDKVIDIKINANTRNEILDEILNYFKIHLGDFKKPNSLKILHDIFK